MFRPGGYCEITDQWGTRKECDTFTCAHCNCVVKVLYRCSPDDLGGMCRICVKMICPKCVDLGACEPFEKKLEAWEERDRALRSYLG